MSDWTRLEQYRVTEPCATVSEMYCSTRADGFNGLFRFTIDGKMLRCLISDGEGWKHVSVSIEYERKPPTWGMMCKVKDLFWDDEDVVIQYHPRKSEYVNMHEGCLHLWQPFENGKSISFPTPPSILVGYK